MAFSSGVGLAQVVVVDAAMLEADTTGDEHCGGEEAAGGDGESCRPPCPDDCGVEVRTVIGDPRW